MTNYVAGHVDDVEDMDSCIGIEFNPTVYSNGAIVYINEEEISLTYEQVKQLWNDTAQVINEMEWHLAEWVYAHYLSSSKRHLMERGKHGKQAKTLCGTLPPTWGTYRSEWTLSPVIHKPWPSDNACKRCLAIYDKQVKEVLSETE